MAMHRAHPCQLVCQLPASCCMCLRSRHKLLKWGRCVTAVQDRLGSDGVQKERRAGLTLTGGDTSADPGIRPTWCMWVCHVDLDSCGQCLTCHLGVKPHCVVWLCSDTGIPMLSFWVSSQLGTDWSQECWPCVRETLHTLV